MKSRRQIVEGKDMQSFRKWDRIVNTLLIAAALFALLTRVAWGLDT
jgi:hypothetical protein